MISQASPITGKTKSMFSPNYQKWRLKKIVPDLWTIFNWPILTGIYLCKKQWRIHIPSICDDDLFCNIQVLKDAFDKVCTCKDIDFN